MIIVVGKSRKAWHGMQKKKARVRLEKSAFKCELQKNNNKKNNGTPSLRKVQSLMRCVAVAFALSVRSL